MKDLKLDWKRLLFLLPIILPATFAVFCTILIIFLLCNAFIPLLMVPVGLVAGFITAKVIYDKYPVRNITRDSLLATGFVLVAALIWAGFNYKYSSEHVYTNRDPGLYAQGGLWLTKHDSLPIPKASLLPGISTVSEETSGFAQSRINKEELYTQGSHIVPALLGLAGRVGGESFLFRVMPVFNSLALLALFAFARELMKDRWAILATGVFAVTLPVIYFSRDTYTELLAAAFTFSSLSLLAAAIRGKSLGLWAIAGLVTGASALTRVDALIPIAIIVFLVAIYMALVKKTDRRTSLLQAGIFLLASAVTTTIGILDLVLLSSGYFEDLKQLVKMEFLLLGATAVGGAVLVALAWKTRIVGYLDKMTKRRRARIVAVIFLLICLAMATRPFWFVSQNNELGQPQREVIANMQQAYGLVRDGKRDYAESTTTFLMWYAGPVLAVAAIGGITLVAYRSMKTRDIRWLALLLVFSGVAMLYLNRPSIFPDQIWASRRQLPVILPAVIIFGALFLGWLDERKRLPWGLDTKRVVTVLATLAVVGPLFISQPFLTVRTYAPQLTQINAVCHALPAKAAVVWIGSSSRTLVQPTRSSCNVPTFGVVKAVAPTSQAELSTVARALKEKGYVPVLGTTEAEITRLLPNADLSLQPISTIAVNEYETTLILPPNDIVTSSTTVSMGVIQDDGSITPLERKK